VGLFFDGKGDFAAFGGFFDHRGGKVKGGFAAFGGVFDHRGGINPGMHHHHAFVKRPFRIPYSAFRIPYSVFRIPHSAGRSFVKKRQNQLTSGFVGF